MPLDPPGGSDGNKRLAWLAATGFSTSNGQQVDLTDEQAFDLVMKSAASKLDLGGVGAALCL